ncbi:MAG: hypothetical protein IH598_11630, partial [Bacteroidales bacterium]|nr:hypothetical protein [Bacteroidales bacterium]
MKKFTFILFMVIVLLQSYGQDYLISFTGSGFSSIVDSVWVINLTRNDSLQICGQDTLHLNPSVATIETEAGKHQITVFPNPMGNASTIDFFCQSPGNTHLGIFDVAGKSLIQNVVSFSHLKKSLMKKQSHFRMLIAALLLLPVMLICTNPVTIQGDNQGKHDPFAATQPNTSSPVFSNEVNTDDTDVLSGPAELCLTAYPFEAGTVSAPCCPAPATLDDPTPIPPEGTGTQEDPYLIASLENLYWLSVETNAGNTFSGKFFLQTADIDATETETWFNGLGWEPIGSEINPFSGAYDGNNFTIESLYIKREYESYLGLFGYLNGAW